MNCQDKNQIQITRNIPICRLRSSKVTIRGKKPISNQMYFISRKQSNKRNPKIYLTHLFIIFLFFCALVYSRKQTFTDLDVFFSSPSLIHHCTTRELTEWSRNYERSVRERKNERTNERDKVNCLLDRHLLMLIRK